MDEFETYIAEPIAPARRRARGLVLYVGFAVLLAAASLVAVNSRGGAAVKLPRVLLPGSSGLCSAPPNGFLFSQVVDGSQMNVCISQQGNINQISYPDTAVGHTQIGFDGYCVFDLDDSAVYQDFSPGSGVANQGFNAATLTQSASNIFNVTRTTTDNRYQLTEFIKINFQPRSVFVGMTVKNISGVTRHVAAARYLAPAIDGSAADDQYNEFGGTGSGTGRTGQAFQGAPIGTNSLLFGATQSGAQAHTLAVSAFQAANGCNGSARLDLPGPIAGGNRMFEGLVIPFSHTLAPGASESVGKFVYRMV
jgi:hypothetical protein